MGHKRVKMELIKNERGRMQTYKKRKANLLKKINEFTILCDVKAGLIIFGPQESEPETWAPDSCNIQDLINQYRTSDQPRRSYSDSDYFAEKKKKVDIEIANLRKQSYKHKFPTTSLDDELGRLSPDELRLILGSLDSNLKAADHRIAALDARRNLGLVHHQYQAVPQNPDVGFGIVRDFQDLSQFDHHQQLSLNSAERNLNDNMNYDGFYPNANPFDFPAEGHNFFPAEQGVGPLCYQPEMANFGSPEKGFSFELIQTQKYHVPGRSGMIHHHGLMNSLPGTTSVASTSRPWYFDSAGNADAGMSLISSSSYNQQIQFSPGAARFANTRMFDGFQFDHKL